MRSLFRIPDDRLFNVTIARFTPQKGHQHLRDRRVEGAGAVSDAYSVLIGDSPEKPAVEALAAELDIGGSVQFLGLRDDVPDLLAAADVFVFASVLEGLALVVLEAMALDLPVVVTRIGGSSEARSLAWRDVRFGAVVTAILFTIGQSLIGWFLGTSAVASSYDFLGSGCFWKFASCPR